MAAVSGLDMEVTTDVLSGRLVQHLMGDLHLGSAGCESLSAIGDEVTVEPLRSTARSTGTSSCESPRLLAFGFVPAKVRIAT